MKKISLLLLGLCMVLHYATGQITSNPSEPDLDSPVTLTYASDSGLKVFAHLYLEDSGTSALANTSWLTANNENEYTTNIPDKVKWTETAPGIYTFEMTSLKDFFQSTGDGIENSLSENEYSACAQLGIMIKRAGLNGTIDTKITITSGGDPTPPAISQYMSLMGTFNNWTNPGIAMSLNEQNIWVSKLFELAIGDYAFKFTNGNAGWGGRFWGSGVNNGLSGIAASEDDGQKSDITFSITESGFYAVTFNEITGEYEIRKDTSGGTPEPSGVTFTVTTPEDAVYCYIIGQDVTGGWDDVYSRPMLKIGENRFTITLSVNQGAAYKYRGNNTDGRGWEKDFNNNPYENRIVSANAVSSGIINDSFTEWNTDPSKQGLKTRLDLPTIQKNMVLPYYEASYYNPGELVDVETLTITGASTLKSLTRLETVLGSNNNITNLTFEELYSTANTFSNINPNCFKYVPAAYAPLNWTNVVSSPTNEALTPIVLTDKAPLSCPDGITATQGVSYSRTCFNDGNWETILLPFAVTDFEQFREYTIESFNDQKSDKNTLRFDAIEAIDQWQANKAYIMKSNEAGVQATYAFSNPGNISLKTEAAPSAFTGTFNKIENTAASGKYLLNATGESFGPASATAVIHPFRAFYQPAETPDFARFAVVHGGSGTTAIDEAMHSSINKISLSNGIIYIHASHTEQISIYTIDGRKIRTLLLTEGSNKIEGLTKGIYLINNHKVAVH